MTLLLVVKGIFELPEELPGDVALQAALDVTVALLLGSPATWGVDDVYLDPFKYR